MIRSLMLVVATGCATLLTFAAPQSLMAQYWPYQAAPRYNQVAPQLPPYQPNQPGASAPYPSGPTVQDLAGTWLMAGNEDEPCQVIPSRVGNRALFINEHGGRAEGFIRGNRIMVPEWGNLQGRVRGETILWSNSSVWTR